MLPLTLHQISEIYCSIVSKVQEKKEKKGAMVFNKLMAKT